MLEPLDARALLSTISATLARGVLTIRRDDDANPIRVDIRTRSVQARAAGRALGRIVVVEGIRSFPAKKVRAVRIFPGPSNDRVTITKPSSHRIKVRIAAPTGRPPNTATVASIPPLAVTGFHSAFETEVFNLINAERTRAGIAPLAVNVRLVTAAQIQARNMALASLMAHDLPGFDQPTMVSRAKFVGYNFHRLAENIAFGYPDPATFVARWMASDVHRANILNPSFVETGVGLGRTPSGVLYVSQEFGTPA